jgi:heme-degrading monooxygenase HmoA
MPQYAAIPGLSFKIFTLARPGREFGGVYLWQDRAAADAWFGPAWHERVRRERGVEADVRMFDAPLAFSTPAADAARPETLETAVVTLVTVPVPPNADRAALREGFVAAAAIERKAPGLLRQYALVNDTRMGGAYLWRDEASARAWFDARWQATMRKRYGVAPQVEWLDAPILLPSTAPANLAAERALFRQAEGAGR